MQENKTKTIKKKEKIGEIDHEKLSFEEAPEQTSLSHLEVVQVLKDVQQLPCSLRQICQLPQQKKEQIKKSHPRLAPYYYLKPRQRAKLFHQINQKYRKEIKPVQPPGSAPRKKTIKFKKRFQIKVFDKNQNSKKIKQKKSSTERQVRNVHFT